MFPPSISVRALDPLESQSFSVVDEYEQNFGFP